MALQPPFSLEAEQSVIGGVLLDNRAFYASGLSIDEFYRADHRLLWQAMSAMALGGLPMDPVTVAEFLLARGELDAAGGLEYLGALFHDTPSAANVPAYARIVRDKAQARRAIEVMRDAAVKVQRGESGAVAELAATLAGLQTTHTGALNWREMLSQTLAQVDAAMKLRQERGRVGVPSGIPWVDERLALHGPQLVIVAGRPSTGKTAFVMQWAMHSAKRGHPVGVISLEMSAEQIGHRALAHLYGVNGTALSVGNENAVDELQTKVVERGMVELPMHLDFDSIDPAAIVARLAEWKARHGIELAVVDYLQLIQTAGDNLNAELGGVTRLLKQTAKRLDLPIIVLSQFNREAARHNRKPALHDLRDSGGIESDADVVIALHGELDSDREGHREVEMGFLKNRAGRVGWADAPFQFDGRRQMFREVSLVADQAA